MQLTTQQKIYAAVLALAVAAFAFDRWVLGPPDGAEEYAAPTASSPRKPAARRPAARAPVRHNAGAGAGVAAVTSETTAGQPAAGGNAAVQASAGALAVRLQNVAQARAEKLNLNQVHDAFRPSASWIGAPKPPPVTPAEVRDAATEFKEKYRNKLKTIIRQGVGGVAIIDNVAVTVGQSIDGFRLVAVKDRSAILRRGEQRVELRLAADAKPFAGSAASE